MGDALQDFQAGYAGVPRMSETPPEAQDWVLDPARPDFRRRMPRPFDDGLRPISGRASIEANAVAVATNGEALAARPSAMTVATAVGTQRLLLSWAREPGLVLVGIEQAPEWDVVGGMLSVPEAHLQSLLPVFAALGVPLKDLREVSGAAPIWGPASTPPGATGVGPADEPPHWSPPGDAVPQRRRPRPPRRSRLATPVADDRPGDGAGPQPSVEGTA